MLLVLCGPTNGDGSPFYIGPKEESLLWEIGFDDIKRARQGLPLFLGKFGGNRVSSLGEQQYFLFLHRSDFGPTSLPLGGSRRRVPTPRAVAGGRGAARRRQV